MNYEKIWKKLKNVSMSCFLFFHSSLRSLLSVITFCCEPSEDFLIDVKLSLNDEANLFLFCVLWWWREKIAVQSPEMERKNSESVFLLGLFSFSCYALEVFLLIWFRFSAPISFPILFFFLVLFSLVIFSAKLRLHCLSTQN